MCEHEIRFILVLVWFAIFTAFFGDWFVRAIKRVNADEDGFRRHYARILPIWSLYPAGLLALVGAVTRGAAWVGSCGPLWAPTPGGVVLIWLAVGLSVVGIMRSAHARMRISPRIDQEIPLVDHLDDAGEESPRWKPSRRLVLTFLEYIGTVIAVVAMSVTAFTWGAV